jgi:hypothetical protein
MKIFGIELTPKEFEELCQGTLISRDPMEHFELHAILSDSAAMKALLTSTLLAARLSNISPVSLMQSFLIDGIKLGMALEKLSLQSDGKPPTTAQQNKKILSELACPRCKRSIVGYDAPNKFHPDEFVLYCRDAVCPGASVKAGTFELAVQKWKETYMEVK